MDTPNLISIEKEKCYSDIEGVLHDLKTIDERGGLKLTFDEVNPDLERLKGAANRLYILAMANWLVSQKKPQS